jgi:hypothetical protein
VKTGKILVITGAVGFVGLGSFAAGLFVGSVLAYDVLERDAKLVREVFGMPPAPKKRDLKYSPYPAASDAARAKYVKRDVKETEREFAQDRARRELQTYLANKYDIWDKDFPIDILSVTHDVDGGWGAPIESDYDNIVYSVQYNVENDEVTINNLNEPRKTISEEVADRINEDERKLQVMLGKISNRLTDMKIRNASEEELAPVIEESIQVMDQLKKYKKKDAKPED